MRTIKFVEFAEHFGERGMKIPLVRAEPYLGAAALTAPEWAWRPQTDSTNPVLFVKADRGPETAMRAALAGAMLNLNVVFVGERARRFRDQARLAADALLGMLAPAGHEPRCRFFTAEEAGEVCDVLEAVAAMDAAFENVNW